MGNAIGNNTHLKTLFFFESPSNVRFGRGNNTRWADAIINNGVFFDSLRRNTSITYLGLGGFDFSEGAGREIMNEYVTNNTNLSSFYAIHCNLSNDGAGVLGSTLSTCPNLKIISLGQCNIDDDILNELVAGEFTGISQLSHLGLSDNDFGVSGCNAIVTLLQNPCFNLTYIDLGNNGINNEGATTLANALKGNDKLKWLDLCGNPITESGWLSFSIALSHFSNHTLIELKTDTDLPNTLSSLLQLNEGRDKEQVASQKVLPQLDMEPFFEWNTEGEGERNLKALPYVVAWFDRAREYNQNNDNDGLANSIDARKLSAIYQFARALPLLFAPPAKRVAGEKRKIGKVN